MFARSKREAAEETMRIETSSFQDRRSGFKTKGQDEDEEEEEVGKEREGSPIRTSSSPPISPVQTQQMSNVESFDATVEELRTTEFERLRQKHLQACAGLDKALNGLKLDSDAASTLRQQLDLMREQISTDIEATESMVRGGNHAIQKLSESYLTPVSKRKSVGVSSPGTPVHMMLSAYRSPDSVNSSPSFRDIPTKRSPVNREVMGGIRSPTLKPFSPHSSRAVIPPTAPNPLSSPSGTSSSSFQGPPSSQDSFRPHSSQEMSQGIGSDGDLRRPTSVSSSTSSVPLHSPNLTQGTYFNKELAEKSRAMHQSLPGGRYGRRPQSARKIVPRSEYSEQEIHRPRAHTTGRSIHRNKESNRSLDNSTPMDDGLLVDDEFYAESPREAYHSQPHGSSHQVPLADKHLHRTSKERHNQNYMYRDGMDDDFGGDGTVGYDEDEYFDDGIASTSSRGPDSSYDYVIRNLHDEIRWIDENAIQARIESERRLMKLVESLAGRVASLESEKRQLQVKYHEAQAAFGPELDRRLRALENIADDVQRETPRLTALLDSTQHAIVQIGETMQEQSLTIQEVPSDYESYVGSPVEMKRLEQYVSQKAQAMQEKYTTHLRRAMQEMDVGRKIDHTRLDNQLRDALARLDLLEQRITDDHQQSVQLLEALLQEKKHNTTNTAAPAPRRTRSKSRGAHR